MPRRNTFRRISESQLAWNLWLAEGENAENYSDWLAIDGHLEGEYQYSLYLFASMPKGVMISDVSSCPAVDLYILTPEGKVHHVNKTYAPEEFKPESFGGAWGDNTFIGRLKPDGMPEGYDIKISLGDMGLDLTCRAVNSGFVFSDEEHGYTYYHPIKKTALGWWPLVPRAEVEGTLTIEGKPIRVSGSNYVERQLNNIPASFGSGAQAWWTWGHFVAGDYVAVWTDSAASEYFQYRHFSPIVLYKGSDPILMTFQCTSYIEKFGIDPVSGNLKPEVLGLRAADGNVELRAQISPGKVVHSNREPGRGVYTRQYSPVNMQLRRWDEVEEASGTAIHEWGAGENWFPFERLK